MRKSTLIVGAAITAALVIGTGGGAYAAATITGANVKDGSLTGADIKDSSVASSDIKNGSVGSSDLTTGVNSLYDNRKVKTGTVVHDGSVDGLGVRCPSGTLLTGGGGFAPNGTALWYSGPDLNADGTAFVANTWLAISDYGIEVSFATCLSPTGAAIPGVVTQGSTKALSSGPSTLSKAEVAKVDAVRALVK